MNLNILQAYCKKRKYDHQSARDGSEAFAAYVSACEAGSPPNICLLDLQMPVCDGITCASMIRAYEAKGDLARCPIIMGELLGLEFDGYQGRLLISLLQSLHKAEIWTDTPPLKRVRMHITSSLFEYQHSTILSLDMPGSSERRASIINLPISRYLNRALKRWHLPRAIVQFYKQSTRSI